MKLIICLLWLWTFSGATAAPNRGRRRHRRILDYFPGCLDLAENSTAFVECMQEHSDERCMSQEMRSEIGTCVLSGFETLRENGLMDPFGMDESQGGNMNQGGMMNPNAQGANSNGNSMSNAPGGNRLLQGNSGNGGMMGNQGESNGGGMMGNQGENNGGGMMGDGQENQDGMGNQGENNGGGMMGNGQGNQGGNNGQANGGMMGNGQVNQGGMMGNGNGGMMGQGQGFLGMMGNGRLPRPMMEMMANCTEDFRECAREKLEEDIGNLPSCAPESMRNLATCVQNNRDACRESCRGRNTSDFRMPHSMPPQSLNNCNGVRNRIYKRICRRGDCCQECFSELESVGTCFVNTIMQHLPENCGMDCESELADKGEEEEEEETDEAEEGTRRALGFEYRMQADIDTEALERGWRHLRRALQEDNSSEIFDACIEVAPGLNENNRDAEELALRSDFFDCVVDEMLTIIVNGTETTDDAEASLESSGASQRGFALKAIAAGLLFHVCII